MFTTISWLAKSEGTTAPYAGIPDQSKDTTTGSGD
jgi:hypothetical protein